LKVIWTEKSKESLLDIYNYIFEKSPQNALMVFEELTALQPLRLYDKVSLL